MGREVKKTNIKSQTYFNYHDMINLKNFESNLSRIDKNHYKRINIYYIGYIIIKIIDDFGNIHSVNPLYLFFNHASGYIKEKNGNKYLIFNDFVNENKDLLKKYKDVWNGIKNEIEAISGCKENDYGKDYIKIKFDSDDDLSLKNPLKFHEMAIIIRSVFEEGGKIYPLIFVDDALYELWKCYSTKKLMLQREFTLIKQVHQKKVCYFKDARFKFEVHVCNKCHDVLMTVSELKNITILNVKEVDFRCILWGISRKEAVYKLKNYVLDDKGDL